MGKKKTPSAQSNVKSADKLTHKKLDAILDSDKLPEVPVYGSLSAIVVMILAVGTAILPLYIFAGPIFDLPLEYTAYFAVVTIVTSALLHLSARRLAFSTSLGLAAQYGNVDSKDYEKVHREHARAGNAYGAFAANTSFLIIFLLLSQQVLIHFVPHIYNYVVATLGSSGLVYAYAHNYI